MPDKPPILDYAKPETRRFTRMAPSVTVALMAYLSIVAGFVLPPISGSMRVGPNLFFYASWVLAFVFTDAYVWLRLSQDGPGYRLARLMTGAGATGALVTLARMLLDWRPAWGMLISLCVVCVLVAATGRALQRLSR